MTTFVQEYLAGRAEAAEVDDWTERWHDGDSEEELHVFLGLTWPEYANWVTRGTLPTVESRENEMQDVHLQGGQEIFAHAPAVCSGPPCPIHWPSQHHMRFWPQNWRNDRKIIERICPEHGVGHPDPDDPARYRDHGCCGCCLKPQPEDFDEMAALDAIASAPVRIWFCPIVEHRRGSNDRGEIFRTVEWREGIAYCLAPGCENSSSDEPEAKP